MPAGRRTAVVIHNPAAGRGRGRRLRATLAALERLGCAVTLRPTVRRGDAETIAAALSRADVAVVVAAGGDGTVNEVVNGLTRAADPPPLAVIPLGTANVLAAEIGLPRRPEAVARVIVAGVARPIHLGSANGRHFVMMAGVGFDAHVAGHIDAALKRRTGRLAYVVGALAGALRYGFPACRVSVDGIEHTARAVVACNGRHYGGRFVAAPAAQLGTPGFEVCLLAGGGLWNVLRYGLALFAGRLGRLADVRVMPASRVVVVGEAGAPVQGDGDVIAHLPVEITVAAATIELIHPQ